MKKILVILKCPITNQGRMINFIQSLSKSNDLCVFYLEDNKPVSIDAKARFIPYSLPSNLSRKILQNSLFWLEYNPLQKIIINEVGNEHFDLVIAHDLPILKQGLKIARHFKCKFLYDSLEIYTETLNQFYPGVKGIKAVIAKFAIFFMRTGGTIVEKKYSRKCDVFTTVNRSLASYFEKKYGLKKVHVIMNCPKKVQTELTPSIDFRQYFGLNVEQRVFLYQGVLNEGRGLFQLIEAMNILRDNKLITLIILGEGVVKEKLVNMTKTFNIESIVKFYPTVPYDKLLTYTCAADFGINFLESFNLSKKLASPNKLFEYMQAGIPVLASFSPENNLVYNEYEIGIQCFNEPDEIAEGMVKFLECTTDQIDHFKEQLAEAANVFNWENQEVTLLELVE